MNYLKMALIGVAIASATANIASAQALYNVGVAAGRAQSIVTSLSADGRLASGFSSGSQLALPFSWTLSGGRTDYPAVGQDYGVSADGRFAAGSGYWRDMSSGGTTQLTPSAGNNASKGLGVSNTGVVVGSSFRSNISEQIAAVAVRWNAAGVPTPLGYLRSNGTYSSAAAITPDGTTIVGSSRSNGLGGVTEPFRWTAATGMVPLQIPVISGFPSGSAFAVSADGTYVAGTANGAAPNSSDAAPVRWNAAGAYQFLGLLPTYYGGQARAISADGRIVAGQLSGASGLNSSSAFIWREGQGTMLLATYLRQQGVSIPSTVYLSDCTCISADGTVFGGTAFDSRGGPLYGFVAVVPAPGTSVLLAAGFAAVLRRRR